eukprot:ANDGO_03182.mRNA.1 tRNA pseudouridine synthase B
MDGKDVITERLLLRGDGAIEKLRCRAFMENAIVAVDKPIGWSSMDVLRKLRHTFKTKKIGFAGTLDPLATGLLICCFGTSTKLLSAFTDCSKSYAGTICLGATTMSQDSGTPIVPSLSTFQFTGHVELDVDTALREHTGRILQRVPRFSAAWKDGRRLYHSAHRGVVIPEEELPKRQVLVDSFVRCGPVSQARVLQQEADSLITSLGERTYSRSAFKLETVAFSDPRRASLCCFPFSVTCSTGTYVRSLASSVGDAIGSGGFLASLERTQVGPISLRQHGWNMTLLTQMHRSWASSDNAHDSASPNDACAL